MYQALGRHTIERAVSLAMTLGNDLAADERQQVVKHVLALWVAFLVAGDVAGFLDLAAALARKSRQVMP